MINNYIFDLYGTLVNIHTDEENLSLWVEMTQYYDKAPEELRSLYKKYCVEEFEKQKTITGSEHPEIDILRVFENMEPIGTVKPEFIAKEFRKYSRDFLELYPDTLDTLKNLKKQGKGLYLLSNAQEVFTMDELDKTGLRSLFDGICISSQLGIKKPDPRFMLHLLNMYQLKIDQCVMIGNDFHADIAIANAVGMKAVHINTDHYSKEFIEHQKYSFDEIQTMSELL